MHTALPVNIGTKATVGNKPDARMEDTLQQNHDLTTIVKRQTSLLSEALAEADEISGSGNEPDLRGSEGLNTTPIVWMCVMLVAVLLLIILCIVGYRRQNQRVAPAGIARNIEESRLPQVGIMG